MSLARRLSMRQLNVVVAVDQYRSIVRAAQHLNLTQPTVTKTLQDAEAAVGSPLFDRTNRGVEPTAAGTALARHARLVLAQLTHAEEELTDLRDGAGGRVAVGSLIAASVRLLPEAIIRLKKARPRVSVAVREGANDILVPALRRGELDVVVGRLPEYREREGIEQEPLYREIACLTVRAEHPLAGRDKPSLAELAAWEWILPSPETTLRRQVEKVFYDVGVATPVQVIESVSLVNNLRLLLDANFIGIMPFQAIRTLAKSGQVRILPVPLTETLGPVGISRRAGSELSPVCEALLAEMRIVAETLRREEAEWRSLFNL
ncbi:LysR substrate-binding domain-containing protein [Azospirillum sp. BE72]|uniref:LysR substrate-binding domain-containing protein n=1 Tax=Azospirillum sp. BE72 TaxID=2817776 RepID=UPI002858E1BF|nr:LysR substrate-binding domain-containing protein [Azospirillum sp. BE72]MDR6775322.1 DNA-binding transcriptional LysR family regulator [Azospirillum sp. BE72]